MSTTEDYKEELTRFLAGFGANVRRARLARAVPFSQEKLAEAARLHRTEVGKIEQGLVEPRLTTVYVLADALGVTIDELLDELWVPRERKPSPHSQRPR
jgi:transcriptional regulator with XRE-family HTH domain